MNANRLDRPKLQIEYRRTGDGLSIEPDRVRIDIEGYVERVVLADHDRAGLFDELGAGRGSLVEQRELGYVPAFV